MFPEVSPYPSQAPGQTTASVSLLAALEEMILQHNIVTGPRLALLLPWQPQFLKFLLGPQEELGASVLSSLGQRIRTPGFRSWISHHLSTKGHKFSLPPWVIRIITATIMVMNK